MASRILDFYRLEKPDSEGRMLEEYWRWGQDQTEQCHDFIQWMFPLEAPSAVNPDAPLLTEEDEAAFRQEPLLRSSLRRSLGFFLNFLGLAISPDGRVDRNEKFHERIALWRTANHNWLRITRVLKSLRLLGCEDEARAVWKCLRNLHEEDGYVSENSFSYWREAAEGFDPK